MPSRHSNPVHGGGDEEARERCPACGEPRDEHIGPSDPPQTRGHLGATEDRPGACLTKRGRFEHPRRSRAGERADAIPENVLVAALDAYDRLGDVESQSDHAAAMTVALAAALRAVQPEAGNEEAEQLRQERDELLRGDALSWYQRVTSERDEARAEVARLRAAHPEPDRAPEDSSELGSSDPPSKFEARDLDDRAPEDEFDIDWIDPRTCPHPEVRGAFCRRCGLVLEDPPDRAPGEVETVARVMAERLMDDKSLDWTNFTWLAEQVIAALDAVRGRSRDDTATLAEDDWAVIWHLINGQSPDVYASTLAMVRKRYGADQPARTWNKVQRIVSRFGGAGRAENEDR